jgi:RNA polymerase sigma-70 factor, ECF subfamily
MWQKNTNVQFAYGYSISARKERSPLDGNALQECFFMAVDEPGFPGHPDEAEIIRRAIQGDKDALIMLYENHVDRVYRHFHAKIGNIVEAQDMTSETFTRAIEALMHGQYVWQGKPFGAWLFAIAGHILQERKRKLGSLPLIENLDALLEAFEPMSQEMDIPDALVQKEEQTALWDVVKKLPSAEQQVLIMRHVYNLPYNEVARRIGRSQSACKQLHYRALNRLRRLLEQNVVAIPE